MATTGIGYRGFDLGVRAGAETFVTRAQSFEVTETRPSQNAYELGTTEAVGATQDATRFRGTLTRYSINADLETAFGGATWASILEADGIAVYTSLFGIEDAKVTGITFTGRIGGWATETWALMGSSGSTGSVTADTPVAGVAGVRAPKMSVEVNSVAGVRAQGYTVTCSARGAELEELNNASIVGTVYDQPAVTIAVDWVQSTNIAGDTDLALGSEQDVVVILSDPADAVIKRLTIHDCHTQEIGEGATIGGWATKRMTYNSLANTVAAGLTVATS